MTISRTDRNNMNPLGDEPVKESLRDALVGLVHGSINLIVQDGVVIQIDRLEKVRLKQPTAKSLSVRQLPTRCY